MLLLSEMQPEPAAVTITINKKKQIKILLFTKELLCLFLFPYFHKGVVSYLIVLKSVLSFFTVFVITFSNCCIPK